LAVFSFSVVLNKPHRFMFRWIWSTN